MSSSQITAYAHSKQGLTRTGWHTLEDHLRGTARRTSSFAKKFDSEQWGWFAGLWHDLGKFAPDWQSFLSEVGDDASSLGEETPIGTRLQRRRGPDHSTAGAIHACEVIKDAAVSRVLAFVIASHHGGLPKLEDLQERLTDVEKRERYAVVRAASPDSLLSMERAPRFPSAFPGEGDVERRKRRYEMFVRLIFSALVDGDFLDTESFMEDQGVRSAERAGWPRLKEYIEPLDAHLRLLRQTGSSSSLVHQMRTAVLEWCRAAATNSRGAFTLTVPTGGGKTLASLAFALRHATHNGLDRVIIALPFLSILDQTAGIMRGIFEPHFGPRVLVEQHSNIAAERDTMRNRLASENWDAPLIVTTQVQLFESLFARRPSHCRKLHNIANSLIILDEVQTLPVGLIQPILEALQELRENYGVTLLLTTATQPALHSRDLGAKPFQGLTPRPTEIVPHASVASLFQSLRRVEVHWPKGPDAVPWAELADEVAHHEQALVIVHRRADAVDLWNQLSQKRSGTLHLSALMCPAHRRAVLTDIRSRLQNGADCLVVSTQLVEAGVDVDFPVVYRAMAGLESLAQSAGRCNREGKLDRGTFVVYRAPTEPVGLLRHHKQIAETMLAGNADLDLFVPETFINYFDTLYAERSTDTRAVQVSRQALDFEETAHRFRMIDDATATIFVPYDAPAKEIIGEIRAVGPSRSRFRALQPYGVAVYPDAITKFRDRGAIELLHDAVWVLSLTSHYDSTLGLRVDREGFEAVIV